jgi:hypothetical protein
MIDPQKDPSVVPRLSRAITDYLKWMKSVRYPPGSCHQHRMQLEVFLGFVKDSELLWQQLFAGPWQPAAVAAIDPFYAAF